MSDVPVETELTKALKNSTNNDAEISDNIEGGKEPTDGEKAKNEPFQNAEKTGRNDSCPCGSGLKYKNCCGKNQ